VTTTAGCAWTASTTASWIQITHGNGTGSGDMRYAVPANTTTSERTGTVGIAGLAHTVRQDAGRLTEVKVSGKVSNLSGGCPSISFTIGSTRIATNGSTRFEDGSCGSVKNGITVEVRGTQQPDGSLLATEVELDD